jgi:CRISPR type III-associated protein (TIGR04423 family)
MRLDKKELRQRYEALEGEYEGYIQLSDRRIAHLFREPAALPAWDELHRDGGFIFEAALYDPSEKKSYLIRQINESWHWIEYENIDWDRFGEADKNVYYSVFDAHSRKELRMVQLWEEREDPVSAGFCSLELTAVVFAGFEKGEAR